MNDPSLNEPISGESRGAANDDIDLDRVWVNVAAEVWRRHPGRLERTAARLLRSPGLARALFTTPSLLLPWLIASAVVLAVGALTQVGAWLTLVLAHSATDGAGGGLSAAALTSAITDTNLYLPYLAVAACCAVIVLFATRPQRGLL